MSTSSVRAGTTAGAAAQVELHGHSEQRARRRDAPAARGQFRGYVFRHSRSPAPPLSRRPVPLRPRPAAGAQQGQGTLATEAAMGLLAAAPQDDDDDDEDRVRRTLAQPHSEAESDLGESNHGDDEEGHARRLVRLRWALGRGRPDEPDGDACLQQSGLPGVDVLCNAASTAVAAARAAIQALLAACMPAAASRVPGRSLGLMLSIQKRYLLGTLQRGRDTSTGTLAGVRQVLMELCGAASTAVHDAPLSEAEMAANALMPIRALNLQRPRTSKQVLVAVSRQDLVAAGLRPPAPAPASPAAPQAAAPWSWK